MKQIYLDNAATTRTAPEVVDAMLPFLREQYGNPSAKYYGLGQTARAAVQKARQQVGRLLGVEISDNPDDPFEIYFTSCGTESDNWALKGAVMCKEKKHIITTAIEHHAILETAEMLEKSLGCNVCSRQNACSVTVLPVDRHGLVNPADLQAALRDDTAIVSVMHANNEIGTIEPIAELAAITRKHGALFHTDAVQTVGKIPVSVKELGVDMLSLSAHKFHGPKGVGALYLRKGTRLDPFLNGGGQERARRAGTYNVAAIVGMGVAAELAMKGMEEEGKREFALVEKLWQGLSSRIPKIERNGHPEQRLPGTLNVRLEGAEGEAVLMRMDMCGVQVSSGSACSTGDIKPSHVLLAIGVKQEEAHGSIRFSLSRETTEADIGYVVETMPKQVDLIRQMSVTWKG